MNVLINRIPTGFSCTSIYWKDKVLYALRECLSNAKNHLATKCRVIVVYLAGDFWLFWFHNGKPFTNGEDILTKGCSPNTSEDVESEAFQGSGLAYTGATGHHVPMLLVGSKCADNNSIFIGAGYPAEFKNRWETADHTQKWQHVLLDLFGDWTKEYNVFYGFKIDINWNGQSTDEGRGNPLNGKMFATLGKIAPDLYINERGRIDIRYCQAVIGSDPEGKFPSLRPKYDFEESQHPGGGSAYRRGISDESYNVHYQELTNVFPTDPFAFEAKGCMVTARGEIVIECFPNEVARLDKHQWIGNVRDGIDPDNNQRFTRGSGSESGQQPFDKAFLVCPWAYLFIHQQARENHKMWARFENGSLVSYQRLGILMDELGLNFVDKKSGPFITIKIRLTEILGIVDNRGNSLPISPLRFLDLLGRQSNFTVNEVQFAHQAMINACQAAKSHVPAELIDWCKKHFPIEDNSGYAKFYESQDVDFKLVDSYISPVIVYDVDKADAPVFDKEFHTGEFTRIALWHKVRGCFLSLDDISLNTKASRGFHLGKIQPQYIDQFKNIPEALEVLKEKHGVSDVPVITIKPDILSHIGETGELIPILPEEYQWTKLYLPSRNVVLTHRDERRVPIGIVVEVPKRPRKAGPPGPGQREKKDRTTRGGVSNQVGPKVTGNLYFTQEDGADEILCHYNPRTDILDLNIAHWFVKKYYKIPGTTPENAKGRHLREIHFGFTSIARSNWNCSKNGGYEAGDSSVWKYEDSPYQSGFDWFLNKTLNQQIADNPLFLGTISKLNKYLTDGDAEKDQELDEEIVEVVSRVVGDDADSRPTATS